MVAGFCLVATAAGSACEQEQRVQTALVELGLGRVEMVRLPGRLLAWWRRPGASSGQLYRPSASELFLAAGTFLYRGRGGAEALQAYAGEVAAGARPAAAELHGHFACLSCRDERIRIVLDDGGFFQLFHAPDLSIISTSFLVASALGRRARIDGWGLIEYVISGAPLGGATLLADVRTLGRGRTIALDRGGGTIQLEPAPAPPPPVAEDPAQALDQALSACRGAISAGVAGHGPDVACALSGGYDSRLALALLREQGARPHLFVYGRSGSADVECAKVIAAGEGLAIDHVDKDRLPWPAAAELPEAVWQNFLAEDGYSWGGVPGSTAERFARLRRVAMAPWQVHGGGGEVFRDFFRLPERHYSARKVALSFWGQLDPLALARPYKPAAYFTQLAEKLSAAIDGPREALPRLDVERLYPYARCRAWFGREASNNSRFSPILLPFLEPAPIAAGLRLPMAWKRFGSFEARMIATLDRRLAAYPSSYGHRFTAAMPLARQLDEQLSYWRPPLLRSWSFLPNRLRHPAPGPDDPELGERCLRTILPHGLSAVRVCFGNPRRLNRTQYARLVSAEYLYQWLGAKLEPPPASDRATILLPETPPEIVAARLSSSWHEA